MNTARFESAGRGVVQEHIGLGDELASHAPPAIRLQIDRQRLLAAVEPHEIARQPVHRRDRGLREVLDRVEGALHRGVQRGVHGVPRHLGDVGPGGERPAARPGEDDGTHGVVVLEPGEHLAELGDQPVVQRVVHGGPGQRHHGDPVGHLDGQRLGDDVAHAAPPTTRSRSRNFWILPLAVIGYSSTKST